MALSLQETALLATLAFRTSKFKSVHFRKLKEDLTDLSHLEAEVTDPKLMSFLLQNPGWREQGKKELDWLAQHGACLIYLGHPDYPALLLDLEDPPVALTYMGYPSWKEKICLSVVGSREASALALGWMDYELGSLLPKFGSKLVLVSGGARGVDQRAHRIALENGAPTIAFLPSGLSEFYPSSFAAWIEMIIENKGAVVSELSPFAVMKKQYFESRNRLIAGLSPITLIIEARRLSGTLITARQATNLNRVVAVVPGFPGLNSWKGSVDLICDGAVPIRDAADLLTLINVQPQQLQMMVQ